ncbi:MAG: VWA domain-containing protein [Deltaproteobacteria bacterium]|nr:VWA domain-containing protein [Deltaproteobacteria bacterium]
MGDCRLSNEMRRVVPGLFLWAAACGDATSLPRSKDAVRPVVVSPRLLPAPVGIARVDPPSIAPVSLLDPIVRGPHQIDEFRQVRAVVDVLWVVDNSASLSNERARIVAELDRFLTILLTAGADFHLGVTTTDLSESSGDGGRLRGPVITRETPRPRQVFQAALDFPSDPEVTLEEGLLAMERALTPPLSTGPNRDFARPDAALAVIIASDEDDGSLGPASHYARFLESFKGPGREVEVTLSAVVGDLPDGCTPREDEGIFGASAQAGSRYYEVAEATGGLVESVCSLDFAPFVERLARKIAGLNTRFALTAPARDASLVVRVNGRVIPRDAIAGWTYDPVGRVISFEGGYVPPPGAEIEVEYDLEL